MSKPMRALLKRVKSMRAELMDIEDALNREISRKPKRRDPDDDPPKGKHRRRHDDPPADDPDDDDED